MSSAITSVAFSPLPAAPGELVTMTIDGTWEQADLIAVTTPDGASGSGTLEVVQPVSINDPSGRKWALVSNNGTVAVYTATA
jgi:hypothetical protein